MNAILHWRLSAVVRYINFRWKEKTTGWISNKGLKLFHGVSQATSGRNISQNIFFLIPIIVFNLLGFFFTRWSLLQILHFVLTLTQKTFSPHSACVRPFISWLVQTRTYAILYYKEPNHCTNTNKLSSLYAVLWWHCWNYVPLGEKKTHIMNVCLRA